MDYQELLNSVKNEFPDKAIDIIEGLELLRMVIDDTVVTIGEKVNESFSEKQYDKLPYYSKLAEEMETYEIKLKEVIDILDIEDLELEDKKEADEEKEIPDHDQYDQLIKVKTWQEMLIKVAKA